MTGNEARVTVAVIASAMLVGTASLSAQWIRYPQPGVPRTADGRPNLTAPAPRSANGKPVLAGVWRTAPTIIGDIARGLPAGATLPIRSWAADLLKRRIADNAREDPSAKCIVGGVPRNNFVPYPFRILETPGIVAILYEAIQSFRQIFTDGRELEKDPNPAWLGYSVGRWDGDVFVVTSNGFNDDVWLDNLGTPATGQLRVTERFIRRTVGRMDIEITIDDPKTYTEPLVLKHYFQRRPDIDMLEYFCNDNPRSSDEAVEP
jgi:hypothetical protein